jgi:excisionase family DNA binding protein
MRDELLTADELAARFKTTPRFVRRLVAERRIEFVKVGRAVRFTPEAVEVFLDSHRVPPMSRSELRRAYLSGELV